MGARFYEWTFCFSLRGSTRFEKNVGRHKRCDEERLGDFRGQAVSGAVHAVHELHVVTGDVLMDDCLV